jgi:C4-dicarboxylate-specific signal transduction histidine kinase
VRAHATQLLSLGRPGAERVEVFDLADLLREVLGTLRSIGRLRGVDAEFSLPEEGVAIVAARVRVSQVFLNLLLNAADAVAAVTDRPKVLRVRVRLSDGRARCAVDDSGPGITDALAERVFEPWFTTKPVGQGTGLGLLVVRHIVEGYGGTVHATRAPEGGASFQFDLPAI